MNRYNMYEGGGPLKTMKRYLITLILMETILIVILCIFHVCVARCAELCTCMFIGSIIGLTLSRIEKFIRDRRNKL